VYPVDSSPAVSNGVVFVAKSDYFIYADVTLSASTVEGHFAGYLFYFNYIANHENWLWLALLPFAAVLCGFNAVVKRLKQDTLIFLWMVIVLLVFSLAQTKIYWYIMPVFPAFAIAIASLLYQIAEKIAQRFSHLNLEKRLK